MYLRSFFDNIKFQVSIFLTMRTHYIDWQSNIHYRSRSHRRFLLLLISKRVTSNNFSVKTTSVETRGWRKKIGKFTVEIALYSRFGTEAVSVNEEIAAHSVHPKYLLASRRYTAQIFHLRDRENTRVEFLCGRRCDTWDGFNDAVDVKMS